MIHYFHGVCKFKNKFSPFAPILYTIHRFVIAERLFSEPLQETKIMISSLMEGELVGVSYLHGRYPSRASPILGEEIYESDGKYGFYENNERY